MVIKIPKDKIDELCEKILFVLNSKKVTLKHLQFLAGSLAFCPLSLPVGRTFSRRIYASQCKASKHHHFIRVTNSMKSDLLVWKEFLHNFNGLSYIPEKNWSTNYDLQLFTDSAGVEKKGCGAFYAVKWAHLQWPTESKSTPLLRDITYLELIPIALAIILWVRNLEIKTSYFSQITKQSFQS